MAGPTFQTVKTPFTNMSWTPDVPAAALQPTEYNDGRNIETDVRSIKTVAGEEYILSAVPAGERSIFVTGGFRNNNVWWYIVAVLIGLLVVWVVNMVVDGSRVNMRWCVHDCGCVHHIRH